jgi:hypothetical protein
MSQFGSKAKEGSGEMLAIYMMYLLSGNPDMSVSSYHLAGNYYIQEYAYKSESVFIETKYEYRPIF